MRCRVSETKRIAIKRIYCLTLVSLLWLAISALPVYSQPTCEVVWQNPIRISFDSTLSDKPQIAISGNIIHLLWYDIDTLGTINNDGIQYSRSTDGGQTFLPQQTILPYDQAPFPGIIAASGQNLYIVFSAILDTFYGTVILRSFDAGNTWQPILPILRNVKPQCIVANASEVDVHYLDQQSGRFGFLASLDTGRTWSVRTSSMPGLDALVSTQGELHGIGTFASDLSTEVGYYYSFNGGYSWGGPDVLSLEDPVPSILPSVAATSRGFLYAIWNDTGSIILRRSGNDGFSWSQQKVLSTDKGAVFSEVAAESEFVAILWDNDFGGSGGIRFRSSNDFAKTFCPVESPTLGTGVGAPVVKIDGNDLHLAWSEKVGTDGEILYRKGLLTDNPDLITKPPTLFALHQNFPNPFNGSTRITYDLPHVTPVQLMVYNVLGQVVATLVNEVQPVGRYNVEFFGSRVTDDGIVDLPTGLYFYRLQTDFFTETRKFLLLL